MADFSKLNLGGGTSAGKPEGVSEEKTEAPPASQESIPASSSAAPGSVGAPETAAPLRLNLGKISGGEASDLKEETAPSIVPNVEVEVLSTDVDKISGVESELEVGDFAVDDALEFDTVNPLLEDDEELWGDSTGGETLTKSELLRGVTGELSERDDISEEDLETFEGESSIVNPLLEDDDDALLDTEGDLAELSKRVLENTEPKRFFPEGLDPEFDKKVAAAPSKKEVIAAEREQRIRVKAAAEQEAKEFKSDFQKKSTETVTVNEKGDTRSEQARERKRLTKSGPNGKLAADEIEFFKNMGSRKGRYTEGLRAADLLNGPLNENATPQERRERLERLERVFDSRVAYRQGASFILNEKMSQVLSFLALFRYAKPNHVAQMFGESPRTAKDRLYRMQQNGLVESRKIYAGTSIWFLTEPGLIVSGYDVRKITDSRLTYSMFPHQFTVNHVAANLWGGKLNVLGLGDFPVKNRVDMRGEPRLGEQLTSELEILSAFSKMKLFEDASQFRPKLMDIRDTEFRKWANADGRVNVPSPEMIYGNEWMYTMFPPLNVGIAYHVPDLVVKRQRHADGKPANIAVEIEINNKPESSYRRTLQAYADDKIIFDKVIWVCKTIGPAKKLEKIGRELGMIQSGKLKIVPIWVEGGVFKGRDLWTI